MNAIAEVKPNRIALSWLEAQASYLLVIDGAIGTFDDIDDAMTVILAVLDPRINVLAHGSC